MNNKRRRPQILITDRFYIAVCTDYLGMLDDSIDDCQLSASSDDGTHSVEQSRLDSTTGWVSSDRGSPYFQTEYVQVN